MISVFSHVSHLSPHIYCSYWFIIGIVSSCCCEHKVIYGAQYDMYSCWYSSVCSPSSGCFLGPYCFLSTLFWNSLWRFWSPVDLLGCKTITFCRKAQTFGRKQLDLPKDWFLCTKLHVGITQNTEIFTRNVCPFVRVRCQVSNAYKTAGNIIILHIPSLLLWTAGLVPLTAGKCWK